jgi:hypothetical protein
LPIEEGAGGVDGALGFGYQARHGLPHVPHALPDLESHLHTRGAGVLRQSKRVARKDLQITDLDESGGQTAQIRVIGGDERKARVAVARG